MKPLNEMTLSELSAWVAGRLTLAIGEGQFSETVRELTEALLRLGYERGRAGSQYIDADRKD